VCTCHDETEGRQSCGLVDHLRFAFMWFNRRVAPAAGLEPIRTCARCGVILEESEDSDSLHEGWCYPCDSAWFESQICRPLVKRLGKRGACRALAKFVREVKRLV
jgi:hypothetical protein